MRFEVFKFLTDSALEAEAQSFAFRFGSSSNRAGKFLRISGTVNPKKLFVKKSSPNDIMIS